MVPIFYSSSNFLKIEKPFDRSLKTGMFPQSPSSKLSRGSPGAAVVGGGGAETPVACCGLPGCACEPPADLCAAAAAWPRLRGRPRRGRLRKPRIGFQTGPLFGHAAPLTAHILSAVS